VSGKLVGEVVQWLLTPAGADLSQAERVVLFTVAERSNPETREMWRHKADRESLYERIRRVTGMEEKSLGNVFGRLAKRGLDVRVPTGVNKRGQPTFANCGHSTRFRLPVFTIEEGTPKPESSIEEWTFDEEETAEAADPPVDNYVPEPVKVHQPMDLNDGCSIDEWTFTPERSINGWTVYPSKNNPSKTDPSSVLSVGELTVRTARAADTPPANHSRSPDDQARRIINANPRYAAAPAWVRRLLVVAVVDALNVGYGPDAITRYARMVADEGRYLEEQHLLELRAALKRLALDVRLGDACEHCGLPECDCYVPAAVEADPPWTAHDDEQLTRALAFLQPIPERSAA
jgi:hypothetical protein